MNNPYRISARPSEKLIEKESILLIILEKIFIALCCVYIIAGGAILGWIFESKLVAMIGLISQFILFMYCLIASANDNPGSW
jgi:hypothetical protein